MKHLFAAVWLSSAVPLAAQPIVSGNWTVQAQPLEDQRARLEACWRQAQESEESESMWRAALDDQKVVLATQQEWGELEGEASLEQEWQSELQNRRATMSLSLPDLHGWETGVAGEWDWNPDQDSWKQAQLRGWLATPEWRGWSAQAEIAGDAATTRFTARLRGQVGPGQLLLETEQKQSEHWQRRWLTRYQWELAGHTVSAQAGRSWNEVNPNYQDQIEAKWEVHF